MNPPIFSGRLALQQRVLPAYRAPLFDALAAACSGGLSVFAGQPMPGESIVAADHLDVAHFEPALNRNFLEFSSPFYQCRQEGLLDWLDSWQPAALIVEANPRNTSTPQAVKWMHDRQRPVLGWGLGAPPLHGVLAPWRRVNRLAFLRPLDGMIAYSQHGADEYCALGIPAGRVFVAANAVSPRPAQPAPVRPLQFPGQPVVLFVGRLQARKRIDNLLHACAALPLALQPRLWIIGDGPARQEYENLAHSIYPAAKFLGSRHGPELDAHFDRADLFVLPGTGGLAVQQAMAHALPVIVAEGDGTQDDLVRPPGGPRPANGWQVAPGDLPELTEALRQALSDPHRLRCMGAESYRIVAEEINIEAMVAAFIHAVQSCL